MKYLLTLPMILGAVINIATPLDAAPVQSQDAVPPVNEINSIPGSLTPNYDVNAIGPEHMSGTDFRSNTSPDDVYRGIGPVDVSDIPGGLSTNNQKRYDDNPTTDDLDKPSYRAAVQSPERSGLDSGTLPEDVMREARLRYAYEKVILGEPDLEPGRKLQTKVLRQYKAGLYDERERLRVMMEHATEDEKQQLKAKLENNAQEFRKLADMVLEIEDDGETSF